MGLKKTQIRSGLYTYRISWTDDLTSPPRQQTLPDSPPRRPRLIPRTRLLPQRHAGAEAGGETDHLGHQGAERQVLAQRHAAQDRLHLRDARAWRRTGQSDTHTGWEDTHRSVRYAHRSIRYTYKSIRYTYKSIRYTYKSIRYTYVKATAISYARY